MQPVRRETVALQDSILWFAKKGLKGNGLILQILISAFLQNLVTLKMGLNNLLY